MNSEELARYQSLSRHDMQNDLQILSMYVELGKEKELLLKQINRMSRRLQAQSHMFHRMPPAVAWELWATDVTWREAGVRHKIETAGDRADSFELRPGWERIFECLRKSGARYSGEASVHLTVSWTAPMPNLRVDVDGMPTSAWLGESLDWSLESDGDALVIPLGLEQARGET
jgi:hypothetical protein